MNQFPRVLISAPTALAKKYCFEEWLDNVMQLSYPNFNVVLFDNTNDGGKFTEYMNEYHKNNYNSEKFYAVNSLKINNFFSSSIIEKMCYC